MILLFKGNIKKKLSNTRELIYDKMKNNVSFIFSEKRIFSKS